MIWSQTTVSIHSPYYANCFCCLLLHDRTYKYNKIICIHNFSVQGFGSAYYSITIDRKCSLKVSITVNCEHDFCIRSWRREWNKDTLYIRAHWVTQYLTFVPICCHYLTNAYCSGQILRYAEVVDWRRQLRGIVIFIKYSDVGLQWRVYILIKHNDFRIQRPCISFYRSICHVIPMLYSCCTENYSIKLSLFTVKGRQDNTLEIWSGIQHSQKYCIEQAAEYSIWHKKHDLWLVVNYHWLIVSFYLPRQRIWNLQRVPAPPMMCLLLGVLLWIESPRHADFLPLQSNHK